MAGSRQLLEILVTGNSRGAVAALDQVGAAADRNFGRASAGVEKWEAGLLKGGAAAIGFAAVTGSALLNAGQAAAALEQRVAATGAIFRDARGPVDEFAKSAAKSAGLSEAEARTATTRIGSLLQNYGFSIDEAAKKSVQLTKLGADLALRFGRPVEEAVSAVAATLRGERDPIEQFGVGLKEADVQARIMALGLDTSTAAAKSHAKAVATLALVEEQTASSVGAFSDAQDTAAGKLAVFRAEMENLRANIGQGVLPVLTAVTGGLSGLASAFNGMGEDAQTAVGSVATVGTVTIGVAGTAALMAGGTIKAAKAFQQLTGGAKAFVGAASGLGLAAGGLLSILALSEQLGHDVTFNLEAATKAADAFAHSDIFGGELERLLGQNASKLGDLITNAFDAPGGNSVSKAFEKIGSVVADPFKSFGAGATEVNRAKDTMAALDQTLAGLVSGGKMETAAALWQRLAGAAQEQGISVNALNALLPGYVSAITDVANSSNAAAHQTDKWAASLQSVSGEITRQRTRLDAATQFDRVSDAVQRYNDLQREAAIAGRGESDEARRVADAERSVADAVRSRADAVGRLTDAQRDLAEFNSADEQHVRGLEREQILRRRTNSAEEARQKEIDLFRFDQRTAKEQERLQDGVIDAEKSVEDATRRVGDAHQDVADAARDRRDKEKNYAEELEDAQRDIDNAALGVLETYQKTAGELGTNSDQAEILRQKLFEIAGLLGPNSAVGKLLGGSLGYGFQGALGFLNSNYSGPLGAGQQRLFDAFSSGTLNLSALQQIANNGGIEQLLMMLGGSLAGPVSPALLKQLGIPQFASGGMVPGRFGSPRLIVAHGGEEVVPAHRLKNSVSIVQTNNFHGGEIPTVTQLDAQNRKLGMRVALAGRRG